MADFDPYALSDEELLDALRASIAASDPMPPEIAHAAVSAFEMRNVDAELLTLLSDSRDGDLALVRSTELDVRELTLASADATIEVALSVEDVAGRRTLHGQVVLTSGAGPQGQLVLHTSEGSRDVPVDEAGLFVARDLPARNVRLEFRGEGVSFQAMIGL